MAVALAVGDVLVTTLPPGMLTPSHWRELLTVSGAARQSLLGTEYQLRAAPLGNSHLLVAIARSRVQTFRNALVRLSTGLALGVVAATLIALMLLLGRILLPLGKLARAAELVTRGQLLRSRQLLEGYSDRPDEVGALARASAQATTHLQSVAKNSQRLARNLESTAISMEDSAANVASGAASQEERLGEVTGTLEPLAKALQQTSNGLQEAQTLVTALSLATSATDQAQAVVGTAVRRAEALVSTKDKEGGDQRAGRTASILQQVGTISQALTEQRDTFQKVRESVSALRACIDITLESQIREQHHGQHAHRATTEISRLARLHASESATLRTAAEQLRGELAELQAQLSALDQRSGEDPGRSTSEERARRDRPSLSEVARRTERGRSGQSLSGPARRGIGTSSSQSLAPVGASGVDRKSAAAAGSAPNTQPVAASGSANSLGGNASSSSMGGSGGPGHSGSAGLSTGSGLKAVGRSSGNYPKVGAPGGEVAGSGTSLRSVGASGMSSSAAGRGGAATSGASMSSSSGTVRPVGRTTSPGVNAGAGKGPLSQPGADLGASSRSLRPVSESADPSSSQSLSSGAPARRK